MKKRFLLLLLCGFVMTTAAWHTAAQSNTTWENAKTIVAGQEVTNTFKPGTVENLWYKMKITKDKWYELPYQMRHTFYLMSDGESYPGNPWRGYTYNDSYPGVRAPLFKAPETTNLYIHCDYVDGITNPFTWKLIEVTDNRVCDNAEVFELDQEITVPIGQEYRWYKTTLQADRYYMIEANSILVTAYDACGGTALASSGDVFHAENAGEYIFKVKVDLSKENPEKFRIYEVPKLTNTTKETALEIEFGKEVMYSHVFGNSLYYKVNLDAGKTYEVIARDFRNQFYYSEVFVIDVSGQFMSNLDIKTSYFPSGISSYFTATETGVYYIVRTLSPYSPEKQAYWMSIEELTDPRICANAVSVAEGENITYNHQNYPELWWKINVEAGNSYLVSFYNKKQYQHQLSTLWIYSDCGLETHQEKSTETFSFTASKTGTYYIRSTAEDVQNETTPDNSFRITKIINQNNTDRASAYLIEPNNTITTSHLYGRELWYKVNVKAGKVYELNGKLIPDANERVEVYLADEKESKYMAYFYPILYLVPETDTYYYIKWVGDTSTIFDWSFNEINDNRVIQGAETVTIGEEISLTPENIYPNNQYWYKVNFKAGEFYEIDFSNAEYFPSMYYESGDQLQIWDATGKNRLSRYYQDKPLFAPEKDTVLYVSISRASAIPSTTLVWKVNQLRQGDNRLCEFAQEITVGVDVEANHNTKKHASQWYKATLEAGKAYEIALLNNYSDMYYFKGNPCGTEYVLSYENKIPTGERTLIYVPEKSVYYFLSQNNDLKSYHSDFTWCIKDTVAYNSLCEFAEEVELDKEFVVDHTNVRSRWYKLNVEKAQMYSINFTSYGEMIFIYTGCDQTKEIESGSNETFAFTAKSTGTYYLNFLRNYATGRTPCTISVVTDNRSCKYAQEVSQEEVVSGTGITKAGLWYKFNLEADSIYEFDFTNIPSINAEFFSNCGETTALAKGKTEKMLFKPTASSTYMLHLAPEYAADINWYWSYSSVEEGDNRLCEYAVEVLSDTIAVNVEDGIKQFWYTYQVEKDKFYSVASPDGLEMEIYTACGQTNPFAVAANTARSPFLFQADSTTTLYLKVTAYNVWEDGTKLWYIHELAPDGRVCEHPLDVELNKNITSSPEQTGPMGGVWYHFMPKTSGFYTITTDFELPNVEDYFPNWEDYFWAVFVYKDCNVNLDPNNPTQPIAQCAHYAGTPEVTFELEANTDYKILIEIFDSFEHNWQISKAKELTGIINVALFDANGDIINASNANVMLYQKIDGSILSADTLTYNQQGIFESKELGYGTYLLYANDIGQGFDGKTYLPGWYENAGVWEDATEIVLNDAHKRILFRPTPAPEDIATGDVSLSGVVYEEGETGQAGKEGVDISIYRQRQQGQGAPMFTSNSPRRIVSETEWELVARVKTDATGKYQIDKLPAGTYMIVVDLPGYSSENSGIVINAEEGKNYGNNNFETDEETKTIKKTATGLDDIEASGIKLYPNPFDNEIVIENVKDSRLEIYNANGLRVYTQDLKQERETIQVNNLPMGVYYFRITKDGKADSFVTVKRK